MLVIVFYATEGDEAKIRAREHVAHKHHARVYDVGAWQGERDRCDAVEIMPDVPKWQAARILAVFGDKMIRYDDGEEEEEQITDADNGQMGEVISNGSRKTQEEQLQEQHEVQTDAAPTGKKAIHKGGGRWFVMVGEERISGPHNREDANRLAAE